MKILKKILVLIITVVSNFTYAQDLITFTNVPGRNPSDKYTCRVREACSDQWQTSLVMQTYSMPVERNSNDEKINGYSDELEDWSASWSSFEFSENTEVVIEISKIDGSPISDAKVRPEGAASEVILKNNKAYVTFSSHANINVDIDGQMEDNYTGMGYNGPPVHTLSLFGNPIFERPSLQDNKVVYLNPGESIPTNLNSWDTIYFAPGEHFIGTPYNMQSNKTFYIPGDAVVHGTIHTIRRDGEETKENWTIYGSGTISGETIPHLRATDGTTDGRFNKPFTGTSKNVLLEGFVVVDAANHTFNMGNINKNDTSVANIYKNLKILNWRINGDGINAFENSVITNCFLRCQDDVFYYGQGPNVKISDCVAWTDLNGAIIYVPWGSENSYFRDINVIYARATWHYWGAGRTISFRNIDPGSVIENVDIKNVLVEDPFPTFPPFFLEMEDKKDGNGNIIPATQESEFTNVVIDNVVQLNPGQPGFNDDSWGKPQNTITGLPGVGGVFSNIVFKNCYYNGKWLSNFADGDFETAFVEDIQFNLDGNGSIASPPYSGERYEEPYTINQPANQTVEFLETVEFTSISSDAEAEYQWQYDTVNGFVNLNNGGQYTGVNNSKLKITEVIGNNNNQQFRCIITSGTCTYISETASLIVENILSTSSTDIFNKSLFSISPNPAKDYFTINANPQIINTNYSIYNLQGRLIKSGKIKSESTTIKINTWQAGLYILNVNNSYIKVIKK